MDKIIIAGGRDFKDYPFLEYCVTDTLTPLNMLLQDLEFVSGGAKGADKLGERYCKEHQCGEPTVMKPDYKNDPPKLAPLRRNRKMAEYSAGGILIAFLSNGIEYSERGAGSWVVRGGTSNMIMNAISNSMDIYIFRY